MLSPKRVKHRFIQRGRVHGNAHSGNTIAFGEYGLVCMEPEWLTARQIEAARIALNRYIKRGGKMWIRIYPDKPYTKKPLETRMGKGKGNPEGWVAVVRPGTVLFELSGVEPKDAEAAMRLAGSKLPVKTRFTLRADTE
jgi:large subunit ribosomal protein L16